MQIILLKKQKNIDVQNSISFLLYLLLVVIFLSILRSLKRPKISYVIISLFYSQGYFLYSFSESHFQFPLGYLVIIFSVFFTIVLSCIFNKKYKISFFHCLGLAISIIGIALNIILWVNDHDDFQNIDDRELFLKGLILSIASSILISIGNILQETAFDSTKDIFEFLTWMGIIGCIATSIEGLILEREDIIQCNDLHVLLHIVCALTCLISFFIIVPFYIRKNSSSLFIISLSTLIFWGYIFEENVFNLNIINKLLLIFGLILIIIGNYLFLQYPMKLRYSRQEMVPFPDNNTEPILKFKKDSFDEKKNKPTFISSKSYNDNLKSYFNSNTIKILNSED